MYLEQNIKGLCEKFGLDFQDFLKDLDIDNVRELSIYDLEAIAEEYEVDMGTLLFKYTSKTKHLQDKLDKIKLLVLDVDGVMTDGGMYFSEAGDQFKKFNTKDGMAIIHLTKSNFQVAIISSGFKGEAVKKRAELLGIQNCTVNREPKMDRLAKLLVELNIGMENVAIIGDDINDLEVMKAVGLSVAPKDAVQVVKSQADIVLNMKGGEGCVREFIDNYLLKEALTR